jgi:hypothetical protein
MMIIGQCLVVATPEETTPQPNAHIGGNQVIGFNNSATVESDGRGLVEMRDIFSTLIIVTQ